MGKEHIFPEPRPLLTPGKHPESGDTGPAEFAPIPRTRCPTASAPPGRGPLGAGQRRSWWDQRSHQGPPTPPLSAPPPGLLGTGGNFPSAGRQTAARLTFAQQRAQHQAQRPAQRRPRPGGRALGAHPASRPLRPPAASPGRSAGPRAPPAAPCPGATPTVSRPAGRPIGCSRPAPAGCAPRRLRIPRQLALWPGQLFSSRRRRRGAPRLQPALPWPRLRPRPQPRPGPETQGGYREPRGSRVPPVGEQARRKGGLEGRPRASDLQPPASAPGLASRGVLRRYLRPKMELAPSPCCPGGPRTPTSGPPLIFCLASWGHLELKVPYN